MSIFSLPPRKISTSQRLEQHSDGDTFLAIIRGEGTVPSFRTDLDIEERWALVHYIRRISDTLKGADHASSETDS